MSNIRSIQECFYAMWFYKWIENKKKFALKNKK